MTYTPSPQKITAETGRYQMLRDRLMAEFPEADGETLADTLEGLSDLPDLIGAIVRSALEDKALVDALKVRIEDLQARSSRLVNRAARKREIAGEAMGSAGLTRLILDDMTLSLRPNPPAVQVTDEEEVPEDYWLPQPPKLDRKALRDDVLSGRDVPGTVLSNRPDSLAVRTR